jgi:phage-related protein
MIDLRKPRRTPKEVKLIAVKDTGTQEAVYKVNNVVYFAEIQNDQDGEFYFLHMNRAVYLPHEFQQKD